MRTYIDRPLRQGIACWPGDIVFNYQENIWETVRVGSVTMSLHTGTHIDAPRHLMRHSASVEMIPDETLSGPVSIIDARGHGQLGIDLFQHIQNPRVLVRTDIWLRSEVFPNAFPLLTPDAAEFLVDYGVILLGVDLPSVDDVESKALPIHHILMNAGVTICEGLDFHTANIKDASAIMNIVPFAIHGADAAPARVWLENISS